MSQMSDYDDDDYDDDDYDDDDLPLPPIRKRNERALFSKGGVSQRPRASNAVDDDDFPLPPTRKRKEAPLSEKGGPMILSAATGTISLPSTVSTFTEPSVHSEQEESLVAGRVKKQKRNPHPNTAYYEMEVLPLLQKVQKSYARHYLAKFSNKDLIEPFWENSQSSQKEAEAPWKCKALRAMKEHVNEEIKISEAQSSNGLHLGTLREAPDIMKYFLNVYRPENFIQVFCFTKAFLDMKTTSEWGLWFLNNIYANLATQVKLYLDVSQKKPQEEAGAWLEILEFWDQMASDRGAGELAKARAEYFGVRPEKKRETVKRPRKSLNGRIFLSEEMPPLPV
ncbi:hypothetical protein V8E54_002041 [Elaphomyces granulatus]